VVSAMSECWSNSQVQASLGALHRAIDHAVSESLHDRRADPRSDTERRRSDGGRRDDPRAAQEGPAAPPPEARGALAPAPADANLVVATVLVAARPGSSEPGSGPAYVPWARQAGAVGSGQGMGTRMPRMTSRGGPWSGWASSESLFGGGGVLRDRPQADP
jgi:hypothetical protein